MSPSTAAEKLTGRGKVDELPFDLLPRAEQGPTGQAASWGRALTRRRGTAVRSDGLIYRVALQRSARGNTYRVSVEEERKVTPPPSPSVDTTPAAKPKDRPAQTQPWEDTADACFSSVDLDGMDHDPWEDRTLQPPDQSASKPKPAAKRVKVTPAPIARPSIDSLTIIELA